MLNTAKFKRIIQLELNEVSRPIIDKLIQQNKLPNFAKINNEWSYHETTSEQVYQHLEPWIQWVTAHTGKTFAEHNIFHLSDVTELKAPQIWESLSEHGLESAIVGSMNALRKNTQGGFFFPDPWSKSGITYPASIQPLWNLISNKVNQHAIEQISTKDLLTGFNICRKFHFPLQLYLQIASQLIQQKINPDVKWRLAAIFDLFLSNIFAHIVQSTDYAFYTLFLNSIAHYQHHYWRHFDTEPFQSTIHAPDCAPEHDPISYGFEMYDKILANIIKLAQEPDTLVIIASGLAQEPYTRDEQQGGMNYYRLKNHHSFVEHIQLKDLQITPLMSRDWQIEASEQSQLEAANALLSGIKLKQDKLFTVTQNTDHSLFVETAITRAVTADEVITLPDGQSIGAFSNWFTNTAIKSGSHIGTGSVWFSQPIPNIKKGQQIPLTALYDIALKALLDKPNQTDTKAEIRLASIT